MYEATPLLHHLLKERGEFLYVKEWGDILNGEDKGVRGDLVAVVMSSCTSSELTVWERVCWLKDGEWGKGDGERERERERVNTI